MDDHTRRGLRVLIPIIAWLVHKVRGRMAEFGVNIPASWHSGRFDQTLYWGAMAARAATRIGYQATGRKIGQEHARYARAES